MLSADTYCGLLHAMGAGDSSSLGDRNQDRQLICVEEGMDCRQAYLRFFSMRNFQSNLSVIVSLNSSITSCKLDGHEIVIDNLQQLNQTHKTWAIGNRPYQKLEALFWNCHVRGQQLLLSTSSQGISSIVYELTPDNELHSQAKLKSIHLQHRTTYFNLNSAKDKTPIDGHTLLVQCYGDSSRIRTQNTKLLCHCNQRAPVLPQSLVGDIPFELVQHQTGSSSSSNHNVNNRGTEQASEQQDNYDDVIVCDSIFSLETSSPADHLKVRLQYNQRALEFELRSSQQQVANHQTVTPAALISPLSASTSSLPTTTTTSTTGSVSSSTVRSTLRVRIRITNFGVCIMPVMMSTYSYIYRFIW